jgi:ABC-type Fe3+-hydroxamate transport system substrate-binding protein
MKNRLRLIPILLILFVFAYVKQGQTARKETLSSKDMIGRTIPLPSRVERMVAVDPGALRR